MRPPSPACSPQASGPRRAAIIRNPSTPDPEGHTMDNIIVYLDDAAWALQQLAPMATGAGGSRTHWVLVACPPHMTRHMSKWVNHAAREKWREKWSGKLFESVETDLRSRGDEVSKVIAKGPLPALTQQLSREH